MQENTNFYQMNLFSVSGLQTWLNKKIDKYHKIILIEI